MMNIKKSFGEIVFDLFNNLFLIVFCISIIYPFYRILYNSFSTETNILREGFNFIPAKVYLGNWYSVLESKIMWQAMYNSVFVVVLSCVYSLFLSVTYAYALSRKYLPGRNIWTSIMVFTMFFGGGLIPTYLLMRGLGLINTRAVLILGGLNAWNTIILRNFFMTIPDELQESATIDGANEVDVLWRIILPLSLPALATVTLWNIVANWNSWFSCMIYITDQNKEVLQVVLRKLIQQTTFDINSDSNLSSIAELERLDNSKSRTNEGIKATALLFTIFPIIISYPFLQKFFVKGIFIGSLKG